MASGPDRPVRRADAICLILLALLPVILEARALLPGRVLTSAALLYWYPPWRVSHPGAIAVDPLQSDMAFVFHPWLIHTRREIRAGRLPLWNPNADAGAPFLANMQSGVFCPFNVLAWILPIGGAIALAAVAKLEVAGIGTYLFVRLLGASPPAALVGGVAFMLSGFVVAWLGWSLGSSGVWLPAVFAGVEWLRQSGQGRATAALAAAVLVLWLGGHPETSAHVLVAAALWTGWRAIPDTGPSTGGAARFLARASAAVALGTVAASVVLIPFLCYLPETTAFAARQSAAGMPVWPPSFLVSMIVPRYLGHPGSGTLWSEWFTSNYQELSGTVGLVPLLVLPCAFAMAGPPRRAAWFFAALAAGCVPFIYLVPVVTPLLAALPGIGMMAHARLILVAGFSLCVLAGLGVEGLIRAEGDRRRALMWWVTGITLILVVLVGLRLHADRAEIAAAGALWYVRRQVIGAVVLLLAGGVAARLLLMRPRPAGPTAAVLLAIQLASSLPYAWTFYPVIPAAGFFPSAPSIEYLRRNAAGERVLLKIPNVADVYGLSDPTGCDAMNPARTARLVTGKTDFGRFGNDPIMLPPHPLRAVLDLLGVRYILGWPDDPAPAPGMTRVYREADASIWRNPGALPLAFLVGRVRRLDDEAALSALETGRVDPRREALVATSIDGVRGGGTAAIRVHSPGSLVVEARAAAPSFLVFLETWDRGWNATIDGKPVPVVRADFAFCGVSVPAGTHRVIFTYLPGSFILGAVISLFALTAIIAILGLAAPRRRPTAAP